MADTPVLTFEVFRGNQLIQRQELSAESVTIGKGPAAMLRIEDDALADLQAVININDDGTIPAVGEASKVGWFFAHDRRNGALLFKSEAFVPQENLFAPPSVEGTRVAPGAVGGANWSPVAYDPGSGLAYVAASHIPMRYTVRELPAGKDGKPRRYTELKPIDEPNWGTLTAIATREGGKIRWQHKTTQPLVGGVLATAGGLVFTGEADGHLNAFDAASGKLLWQFQCGAGVNAPPISYAVNGVQYVAVAAGGNSLFGSKRGGALVVFALPTGGNR